MGELCPPHRSAGGVAVTKRVDPGNRDGVVCRAGLGSALSQTALSQNRMGLIRDPEENGRTGKALAALTNGLVHLLSQSYGRGPTKAKSYLLDDSYVVCVLEDTMTTV